MHPTPLLLTLLALGSGACLDPQVSDEVAPKGLVLPPGSIVESAHDDPDIERVIAANDGVEGLIPLLNGFAGGQPVHFWDFGPTPEFAAPIFLLVERNAEGEFVPIPHNTIFEHIPGDATYSPYWSVLFLEVTDAYAGELITSFGAIEEAQALGLLEPAVLPTFAVNCPVVANDVTLEVGGGQEPLAPPSLAFWEGKTVKYYDLGKMPLIDGTIAVEAPIYELSREGQVPLSEPLRGVDITGDGDVNDSNDIFASVKGDTDYTPLSRRINVTVPSVGVPLIDTSGDENSSGLKDAEDIFDPGPVPGRVIAFDETDELRNLPQQSEEGGL